MKHSDLAAADHCSSNFELLQAWELLRKFTKAEARDSATLYLDSASERQHLRDALETVAQHPLPGIGWDPGAAERDLLVGVLASDVRLAVRALRDWTQALHVPFVVPTSRVRSPGCLCCWAAAHVLKRRSCSAAACLEHTPR